WLAAMMERNPEMRHVFNDPAFLRQTMNAMRNPEVMQEMMRNHDRQLSNIEAIPGGMNYLSSMYRDMQEPLAGQPDENPSTGMYPSGASRRDSFPRSCTQSSYQYLP